MLTSKLLSTTSSGDPAWNLANAVFTGTPINYFYVGFQETLPRATFFKPDGLKMYVLGQSGDDVNEYNLSTAWDISTASFLQVFSIAAQEATPLGLFFKPDGLKMYVVGELGDDVNEYNLSTAWNVSTASFLQVFSIAAQETAPTGIFFKPDGLKMYVTGATGDNVNEYNLSTAWNVSTASFLQSFSVAAQELAPSGIFFKPDGLKMYVTGAAGDDVNEYNLSTAWNVSTASFLQVFPLGAQDLTTMDVFFAPDGLKMYITGGATATIYQYNLSTAWNVSTLSFTRPSDYFSFNAQDSNPTGIFFKPDGSKMYMIGDAGDDVNEYNLSTAWSVSTASFLQTKSTAAEELLTSDVVFRPDGLKMYVTGYYNDGVYEYNLATAWNISTASFLQKFSTLAQDSNAHATIFKPDGLKMYIIGSSNDNVNEYNLSTAWNISTASFLQSFSVAAQETAPRGLFIKPDGLKMYVVGTVTDAVLEYNLSTAWDVSTASFLQSFSVAEYETVLSCVFFKPDGLKMYIAGDTSNSVHAFSFV